MHTYQTSIKIKNNYLIWIWSMVLDERIRKIRVGEGNGGKSPCGIQHWESWVRDPEASANGWNYFHIKTKIMLPNTSHL